MVRVAGCATLLLLLGGCLSLNAAAERSGVGYGLCAAAQHPASGERAIRTTQRVTKQTPSNDCTPPPPATDFVLTDSRVYLWFSVDQANKGDRLAYEWIDPSGNRAFSGNWNPLTSTDGICFWAWIAVSGASKQPETGLWRASVSLNDAPLFSLAFTILPAGSTLPTISRGGVVNIADFTPALAPGTTVAIRGASLASRRVEAATLPLPDSLDGVSVEVNGSRAPLFLVSPGQINAQLPFDTAVGTARVQVRNAFGAGNEVEVNIARVAPRLVTDRQDGLGPVWAAHADGSDVMQSSPARPGERIVIRAVGLGEVTPAARAGAAGASPPGNQAKAVVTATIGGLEAPVAAARLTPTTAGIYDVELTVPASLPPGAAPVMLRADGTEAQQGATLQVGAAAPSRVIASARIGPEGGTLSGGGFELTVPQGAFRESREISVSKLPVAGDTGGAVGGAYFRVDGVPPVLDGPLAVALENTGPAGEGSESFLMLAPPADAPPNADGRTMLQARYENGRLLAEIPAGGGPAAQQKAGKAMRAAEKYPNAVNFAIVDTGVKMWHSWDCSGKGQFRMQYRIGSAGLYEKACEIQEALETARAKLEAPPEKGGLGADWSRYGAGPVWVFIDKFFSWTGTEDSWLPSADTNTWGRPGAVWWNRKGQQLELNERLMGTPEGMARMKRTAAHELFHIVQNLYDPRGDIWISRAASPWLWWEEAASTWFERAAWPGTPYVANTITEQENFSFLTRHSLERTSGAKRDVQEHGYGASLFLQHLTDKYGAAAVADVLQMMSEKGSGDSDFRYPQATQAIETFLALKRGGGLMDEGVTAEWKEFARKFMSLAAYQDGPRFPDAAKILALASSSQQSQLTVSVDRRKTSYSWDAPDLSAKFLMVQLGNVSGLKNAKLRLRVSSEAPYQVEMLVCRFRSTGDPGAPEWIPLGRTGSYYDVEDVDAMSRDKSAVVAMVANGMAVKPYDKKMPVTVTAELLGDTEAGFSAFSHILVQPSVTMSVTNPYNPSATYSSSPTITAENFNLKLEWSGNAFKVAGRDTILGTPWDINITGSVDSSGRSISLAADVTRKQFGDWDIRYKYSISGLPLSAQGPDGAVFECKGNCASGSFKLDLWEDVREGKLYSRSDKLLSVEKLTVSLSK